MANELKLWNTTRSEISIDITQYPSGGDATKFPAAHDYVVFPALSVVPTVVKGDQAERLAKHPMFKGSMQSGALRDVRPGLGDEKRATSEPKPPADARAAATVGSAVGQVKGMERPLQVTRHEKTAS